MGLPTINSITFLPKHTHIHTYPVPLKLAKAHFCYTLKWQMNVLSRRVIIIVIVWCLGGTTRGYRLSIEKIL